MALKARTTAETTVQALATQGLHVIATVRESPSVTDLAVERAQSRIVVRCVERATQRDARALATMLNERDFDRAFIVYTAEDQPQLSGEIESYPLSRIDELASLLAKESLP
jgi:hypothetical protein